MSALKGLWGLNRFFSLALIILFFGLAVLWPNIAGASEGLGLEPPEWRLHKRIDSSDGFAQLQWRPATSNGAQLFLLTESYDKSESSSYVEGSEVLIYRSSPGNYRFWLQSCARGADGFPVCGRKSSPIDLSVGDEINERFLADELGPVPADVQPLLADGPSRLRPGLWFNPDRDGHGYSFYWANRLALPESHALHGNQYDLLGLLYNFEAKCRFLEGSISGRPSRMGPNCFGVLLN